MSSGQRCVDVSILCRLVFPIISNNDITIYHAERNHLEKGQHMVEEELRIVYMGGLVQCAMDEDAIVI